MQETRSNRMRRIVAGSIGIMLLFILLFSSFYIVAECDHECDGHDCPICECIHQCETVIHMFRYGETRILVAAVFAALLTETIHILAVAFSTQTPVSTKVQMNN